MVTPCKICYEVDTRIRWLTRARIYFSKRSLYLGFADADIVTRLTVNVRGVRYDSSTCILDDIKFAFT